MGFFNVAHAAGGEIAIHLAPDVLGHVFGLPITNTLLTVWFTMAVILALTIIVRAKLAAVPGRLQAIFEALFDATFSYMADVLESKKLARRFFPLVMTIFVFILAMNWIGLLPGVDSIGMEKIVDDHGETVSKFIPLLHPAATDLNITIAFSLIAFFAIELSGILLLGAWKYGGKFFNFSSPLNFLIGIIEFFSELARLISFAFRLFGNIFAGKTLILVVMFFVPFILPVPLLAFEVFVGFIQAFIFAILTLYFIKVAIAEPHASH
jgi:F-type H+-transporting ATPase subunit a